eukprot:gnl/Spiro4/222_TR128_c0_g1_i1.p1 gnl/Spiro4/222_TR128_c0_g1~~gnl/Spiro4/222_TR128_c0_g1_i1.p1  ORF type:complete len:692 (+),score=180.79 gnl/Spiro4/222_TR128_c0_g1_i1:54-2078(+)
MEFSQQVLESIDVFLTTRTFLTGERVSLEDCAFAAQLDGKIPACLGNLTRWHTTVVNQPEYRAVHTALQSGGPKEAWTEPPGTPTGIFLSNSLCGGRKVPFIVKDKTITWYVCGPTVYAPSHMGHARNYLTWDILRRILEDYFGFEVELIMNVTDIDDKIINRANESGISCKELSSKYEAEFFEDMKLLWIKPPDVITRVTEYVPEIIDFTQKIIDNGFAYENNGSVYFDVQAFKRSHVYAKLEPGSQTNQARLDEGEGNSAGASDKRHPADFALWKRSKVNEPVYESQWGGGRPGWHIECSAMASKLIGRTMDLHSGGEDLKFPHHDNELAQSEAYFGHHQWVNYFCHTGHLLIAGQKMSKSLKNFTTIRDALAKYTTRQIRLLFLLHKWEDQLNYSEDTMSHALQYEAQLLDFFTAVKTRMRNRQPMAAERWEQVEETLAQRLRDAKEGVRNSLLDNFNTPEALRVLMQLRNEAFAYARDAAAPRIVLLLKIAAFITRMFKVFGVIPHDVEFGFPETANVSVTPYLDAFTNFRDQIRRIAANREFPQNVRAALLQATDHLREEIFPSIGVRLVDTVNPADGSPSAAWSLCSAEEVRAAKAQKLMLEEAKAEKKRKEAAEKAARVAAAAEAKSRKQAAAAEKKKKREEKKAAGGGAPLTPSPSDAVPAPTGGS